MEGGGIRVGIFGESPYQVGTTRLQGGDWLVVFTDGVVEAVNQKNEEYGEPELIRLVDGGSGAAPPELLRRLLGGIDQDVGNTPQHGGMTCLLVRRTWSLTAR